MLVTPGEFDVVQVVHVDEQQEQLYFIASPGNATQRHLYRVGLTGQGLTAVDAGKICRLQ